ncbi:MAG TPA: TonB-dependent receptor [Candidatus Marinimicrobia bacterium]|nr:TonB-dependent receptor [Candidatus Neomarinimicrobiota bacterium]
MTRKITIMVYISLMLASIGTAQTEIQKGAVSGRVIDRKSSHPLAAVNIIIHGTDWGTMTDEEGIYTLSDIPAGTHHIRFSMMGYKELKKLNVSIHPGNYTTLNIELEPDVLSLGGVTVVAPSFQKSKGAVVSERSIDLAEIRSDPGSMMDIQRSVQVLPSVASGTDQMNEIIIRGGAPGENLFVMDDIEIPNPNHFGQPGSGGGPINLINSEFIQNIDFYAGAFPAIFGDKASSVMNIQFREGSRENRQYYIDMGMAGLGASAEGPAFSGSGSYLLTYHKSYLDLIAGGFGLSAIPHYWNTQGKIVWQFSKRNRLALNYVYGKDDISIEASEDGDSWSRGAEKVTSDGYIYATGASLTTNWTPKSFSRFTLYRNSVKYGYDVDRYLDDGNFTDYVFVKDIESETALKGYYSHKISDLLDIQTGGQIKRITLDFLHDIGQDTLFLYDLDGNVTAIDTVYRAYIFDEINQTQKNHAFTSLNFHPVPKLTLILGMRADHFKMNDELTISPRLGMSYAASPLLNLNLGYGRHYQTPHYFEILENEIYLSRIANSDDLDPLKSKYSDQLIGGIELYLAESIKFSAEIYTKDYRDLLTGNNFLTADTSDKFSYYVSGDKARSKGLELYFHKKMYDNWYAILSYSYSVSERYDPRLNVWFSSAYDYRHIANAVAAYRWKKSPDWNFLQKILTWDADEFTISVRYRYSGGRPYTSPIYDPQRRRWFIPSDQSFNQKRYPYYSRLDLNLEWRVKFVNKHLISYFNIQNILNRDNIWDYTYAEDGTVGEILQFKPVPMGGFILEF